MLTLAEPTTLWHHTGRPHAILPGTSRLCLVIHSIPQIWHFGRREGAFAIKGVYDLSRDASSRWACARQ